MDDEETVVRVATQMLEKLGYQVDSAPDGAAAIEKYQHRLKTNKPYDAVILDLTVPGGMGGKLAIKQLKKIDPSVKAIIASGYSEDPVMANGEEYGFVGIVAKPFTLEDLSEVLSAIFSS